MEGLVELVTSRRAAVGVGGSRRALGERAVDVVDRASNGVLGVAVLEQAGQLQRAVERLTSRRQLLQLHCTPISQRPAIYITHGAATV